MNYKTIIILSLTLFFWPIITYSQSWILSSHIRGSDLEPKYSQVDQNGNLYILSSYLDTIYNPYNISSGNRDLFLLKINNNGNIIWSKSLGSINLDVAGGLILDNSNNIYVSGYYYNAPISFSGSYNLNNTGSADIFLAKYDSNGNLIWANDIGRSALSQGSLDLKIYNNSQLIIAGFYRDSLIIGKSIDSDTLAMVLIIFFTQCLI